MMLRLRINNTMTSLPKSCTNLIKKMLLWTRIRVNLDKFICSLKIFCNISLSFISHLKNCVCFQTVLRAIYNFRIF